MRLASDIRIACGRQQCHAGIECRECVCEVLLLAMLTPVRTLQYGASDLVAVLSHLQQVTCIEQRERLLMLLVSYSAYSVNLVIQRAMLALYCF